MINKLELVDSIRYVSKLEREELRNLYCASDLAVVPSLWEDPYPTVVLEAMANGRPVVAYANGGIPELIPPYGGVVVKRKNPILLAKAMEMTMQGTVSFNETSTIELVRGKILIEVVAQKLIKLFMAMVSSSS